MGKPLRKTTKKKRNQTAHPLTWVGARSIPFAKRYSSWKGSLCTPTSVGRRRVKGKKESHVSFWRLFQGSIGGANAKPLSGGTGYAFSSTTAKSKLETLEFLIYLRHSTREGWGSFAVRCYTTAAKPSTAGEQQGSTSSHGPNGALQQHKVVARAPSFKAAIKSRSEQLL